MSKFIKLLSIMVLITSFFFTPFSVAAKESPKNVIILMTDGTASAHHTITRWYKGAPLSYDDYLVGGLRTYCAESVITDSAPAATAFATGQKSNSKFLGINPEVITIPGVSSINEDQRFKPLATVLEGAKLMGKATGLVATSNIQHASPAAFSAHTPRRDDYNLIAKQQVYLNIDVVLGGGKQYLLPLSLGGKRQDNENLVEVLKARGYNFVETKESLIKNANQKVWGLFAEDAMAYDFDRQAFYPQEPSLAEMTQEAINLLSKNPKGFFLFVEASKTDWAAHANDPIGVISEVLAYDKAVEVALNFAKKNKNTLVLIIADHGTGGMSLGNKNIYKFYDRLPYEHLITPLKEAKLTGEGIEKVLGQDRSEANIRLVMYRDFGIKDLTSDEIISIQKASTRRLNYTIGPMISNRSAVGWIYNGHTGEDLFLWAYGPNHPTGLIENTQIAHITAAALGFNLVEVNKKLFIDSSTLKDFGYNIELREDSTPQLILKKGINVIEIPLDTNILKINNKIFELSGLSIYIPPTHKAYVPYEVISKIKELK